MRFGWFDVVDDPDVTLALLDKVENWAREEKLDGSTRAAGIHQPGSCGHAD